MALESGLILSAIVLAFAVFATVLAWADRWTRHLADTHGRPAGIRESNL